MLQRTLSVTDPGQMPLLKRLLIATLIALGGTGLVAIAMSALPVLSILLTPLYLKAHPNVSPEIVSELELGGLVAVGAGYWFLSAAVAINGSGRKVAAGLSGAALAGGSLAVGAGMLLSFLA